MTYILNLEGESEGAKKGFLWKKQIVFFFFLEGQIDFQENRQEMGKFVIMFTYTGMSGLWILFTITNSLWRKDLE